MHNWSYVFDMQFIAQANDFLKQFATTLQSTIETIVPCIFILLIFFYFLSIYYYILNTCL